MNATAGVHSIASPDHANEDRYRLLGSRHPLVSASDRGHLYAVMDGVGGAPMGMRTAQLVADRLAEFFSKSDLAASSSGLHALLASINEEAFAWGLVEGTDRPRAGAAATIAWLAPAKREVLVVHAGDTIALRYDGASVRVLTQEHAMGRALTRFVGQGPGFRADVVPVPFDEGDRLCLVTDGVTKGLRTDDIQAVLDECAEPSDAAKELVVRARRRGSRDDITAIVVDLEEW